MVSHCRDHEIRPLCHADQDRLLDFFASHSRETVFYRYGYSLGYMSAERAGKLVDVDQIHDVAFGAFRRDGQNLLLDAVGRYYTTVDPRVAEIAFVVRETVRRQGIASRLFGRLCEAAISHGVNQFMAQVSVDNHAMRGFISRYPHETVFVHEAGVIRYYIPVLAAYNSTLQGLVRTDASKPLTVV